MRETARRCILVLISTHAYIRERAGARSWTYRQESGEYRSSGETERQEVKQMKEYDGELYIYTLIKI